MSGGDIQPPARKNPDLLLIDTDSLLQLLIAEQMRLLRFLKKKFRIQSAIVEAVEAEVRKSKKFRAQFTKELQKAIESETVVVIDPRTIPAFVSTGPAAVFDAIQTNGLDYEQRGLDYGEAYTFAAGVALDVPVVSNDLNAILTAKKRGIKLPQHLFRTYDLFVLCHQSGELTVDDCDGIRKTLIEKNEFVPVAFEKTSFAKGIDNFYPRILDSSKQALGSTVQFHELDVRLTIVPY